MSLLSLFAAGAKARDFRQACPVLVALLLAAGCASTPEASREANEEAKRFEPVTRDAVIYIYRPDRWLGSASTTLWADGRLIGESLPGSFFRVIVFPGPTLLHTSGPDTGRIEVSTRGNDITYVEMRTENRDSPRTVFRLMREDEAQAAIRACCTKLEVWRPGQQRFLLW
jgi:hypothetical protein